MSELLFNKAIQIMENTMKKRYSFSEIIKNAYSIIFTKFFYKDARLIRKPLYIRCKYKNNFIYGKGLTTGYCCRIELDD